MLLVGVTAIETLPGITLSNSDSSAPFIASWMIAAIWTDSPIDRPSRLCAMSRDIALDPTFAFLDIFISRCWLVVDLTFRRTAFCRSGVAF